VTGKEAIMSTVTFTLDGRNALVTGAASGIGRRIAAGLAEDERSPPRRTSPKPTNSATRSSGLRSALAAPAQDR
jgi:hypothetical protein